MMHLPPSTFTPALTRDRTIFHVDGTRTVIGSLGAVRYDALGNATFLGPDLAEAAAVNDTTRWDLAA